jgi:curli biogenesis system outer membrane secretion channel CsgG
MSRPRLVILQALQVLIVFACATLARVGLAAPNSGAHPATVAVLYFDYDGKTAGLEVLRKGLAQMLISDLTGQDGWLVVERERLEAVLAEQKLAQSGKIDKATAAKLGKLLGARYLVVGSYFDLMGALRVDARLVSVETGEILGSAGTTGKPDDFLTVEQKIGQDLGRLLGQRVAQPTSGQTQTPKKSTRPKSPARLKTRTAVAYSQALALLDNGQRDKAKAKLEEVVKEQPDFAMASIDLNRLMQ